MGEAIKTQFFGKSKLKSNLKGLSGFTNVHTLDA